MRIALVWNRLQFSPVYIVSAIAVNILYKESLEGRIQIPFIFVYKIISGRGGIVELPFVRSSITRLFLSYNKVCSSIAVEITCVVYVLLGVIEKVAALECRGC